MKDEQIAVLHGRVREYLADGGLFNPELGRHDAVRQLIIDLSDALWQQPLVNHGSADVMDEITAQESLPHA